MMSNNTAAKGLQYYLKIKALKSKDFFRKVLKS